MFDEQIDRLVNGLGTVQSKFLNDLDTLLGNRMSQLQEMLNGIKVTINVEMPTVKQAQPNP